MKEEAQFKVMSIVEDDGQRLWRITKVISISDIPVFELREVCRDPGTYELHMKLAADAMVRNR